MNVNKSLLLGLGLLATTSMVATPIAKTTPLNDSKESKTAIQTISGLVTDRTGQVLPGVVVKDADGNAQTVTGADGRFSMQGMPGETLNFSYLGYETTSSVAQSDMKVRMKEDVHTLQEIVVNTQKSNQTAVEMPIAVSAVTGDVLGKLNINQMDEMATMTPGVQNTVAESEQPRLRDSWRHL